VALRSSGTVAGEEKEAAGELLKEAPFGPKLPTRLLQCRCSCSLLHLPFRTTSFRRVYSTDPGGELQIEKVGEQTRTRRKSFKLQRI
jgi:hypothetical protein